MFFRALFYPLICCSPILADFKPLFDNKIETTYQGKQGEAMIPIQSAIPETIAAYRLFSSSDSPVHDPVSWVLQGSSDGKSWVDVDSRENVRFIARLQAMEFILKKSASYKHYRLKLHSGEALFKLSEITLDAPQNQEKWASFALPRVIFKDKDADSDGSKIYLSRIQDAEAYIQYHAREVAKILYSTPDEPMPNIQTINYSLEGEGPLSAKGGAPPTIYIMYNTKHIENAAKSSLVYLDSETRGVLFHELTHAYQQEPKGCGNYSNNKTFWSCIEGLADAVRFESGFYNGELYPAPGGHWEDGYRTTGSFLIWLKTKNKDALRLFNRSVRDLEVWSFDAAVKYMFGKDASIEALWNEYQLFLKKRQEVLKTAKP